MKTYILRPFKTVEPQNTPPHRDTPVAAASAPEILGCPAGSSNGAVLFLGLDVHNNSIAVSLASSRSTEVRPFGIIGGSHKGVSQ